jgi:hypothetical protein
MVAIGDPRALEHLVLRAFELDDAEVRWPYEVAIDGRVVEQIDGAVYADGLACLVECKDTADRVNVAAVAKLRGQLLRRPAATAGLLFSRSGYTDPALTLARFTTPQTMLLWFPEEIEYVLERGAMRRALVRKYRRCVEDGTVDYKVNLEASG